MMPPALFHAQLHAWAFFCTLTFAGKVPSPGHAYALQRRWLDRVGSPLLHTNSADLQWLSREECGELNGRFHLHLLIGEIRDASRVNPRTCLALMSEWEKVTAKALGAAGMARVRVFQPNLQGADYVLKGLGEVSDWSQRGANAYELSRFNAELGRTVRLARSLAVCWLKEKGHKYGQQARSTRDAGSVKCEL